MKVLIVSDTHRKNDNYFKTLEKVKPDMVIHCGDAEGSEEILTKATSCPVHIVLGNNDFFSYLPKELELEIGSFKVWVTHGHNYYVSMGSEIIEREARARGFDIVMFGHTHKPMVHRQDGIIALNPGSLSYPRQEGRWPSYIVMDVEGEKADFAIEYL